MVERVPTSHDLMESCKHHYSRTKFKLVVINMIRSDNKILATKPREKPEKAGGGRSPTIFCNFSLTRGHAHTNQYDIDVGAL